MTRPGGSLWNKMHKTWTPSNHPQRCTNEQNGRCDLPPIKGVTLCRGHAIVEHARVGDGLLRARATYETYIDMFEILDDSLRAAGYVQTGVDAMMMELERLKPTKKLSDIAEQNLPQPGGRGRPRTRPQEESEPSPGPWKPRVFDGITDEIPEHLRARPPSNETAT
jgi:hypothetical protein